MPQATIGQLRKALLLPVHVSDIIEMSDSNKNYTCTFTYVISAPPSACRNIQVIDSLTTSKALTVQWTRPQTIGRDDFYYNIHFKLSAGAIGDYVQHNTLPYKDSNTSSVYTVGDLIPYTSYRVRVSVHNGVSDQHTEQSMCQTTATTSEYVTVN